MLESDHVRYTDQSQMAIGAAGDCCGGAVRLNRSLDSMRRMMMHGEQEGRFFTATTMLLLSALYVFCGRHLLLASCGVPPWIGGWRGRGDGAHRCGDSPSLAARAHLCALTRLCRDDLMGWCEANGVDSCLGWRATSGWGEIAVELDLADAKSRAGSAGALFRELHVDDARSWSRGAVSSPRQSARRGS